MATILNTQQNEALRLAAWRDDNQDIYPSRSDPYAETPVRDDLTKVIPPGPASYRRPAEPAGPPTQPRYRNFHVDLFAGIGATVERFTFSVGFPVLLEEVILNIASADGGNSHIHLLIRRGQDTSAGLTDDDLELWTDPDPTAGVGAIMATGNDAGSVNLLALQPLLDPPFSFHVRGLNFGGAVVLHFNVVFRCRIIEREDLASWTPAPLLLSNIFGPERPFHQAPRRRMPPGEAPTPNMMRVCGPGYCRNIPFAFLDPSLQKEYIVAKLNNEQTPGIRQVD